MKTEDTVESAKQADLAGPGIGNYEDVAKSLPPDYRPLLDPVDTQRALYSAKTYIETNLCKALSLTMVQLPLMVDSKSGVNDMLDRDGSRNPV
jgi:aspartate--ammonia ligase